MQRERNPRFPMHKQLRYPQHLVVSEGRLRRTFDQRFVGDRLDRDGLLQEPVEELATAARFAPVESEREFIEVGIQMLPAHTALVGSKQPALEQGDGKMNARHQLPCRFAVSLQEGDLMPVTFAPQRLIPQPAVGVDHATRLHRVLDEGHKAFRPGIRNAPHPDPADPLAIFFHCNCKHRFAFYLASLNPFLFAADQSLVYFYPPLQPIPARTHHGVAQFMQHRPGRLVALQAQHALQAHGADPVLLAGHPPHRPEPQGQWQAAVLKDRSRSHRNLAMTPRALPQQIRRRPRLPPSTARALEAIRPAQLKQICPAGLLGRKPGLQFQQISRIVLHGPKHYRLWSPESSKYPSRLYMVGPNLSAFVSSSRFGNS